MLIAAVNSQCRLIFNAGREGLLPRWIGKVQPVRRTPVNAIIVFVGIASAITLVWALGHWIGGHGNSLDALNFFFESSTMGTILILVVYFAANLALPFYYRKYRPDEFNVVKHIILPVLGMAAIAVPVYYLCKPASPSRTTGSPTRRSASSWCPSSTRSGWSGATPAWASGSARSSPMSSAPPVHPLDPATAAEYLAGRDVMAAAGLLAGPVRFAYYGLEEPPKDEVLAASDPENPDRRLRAFLVNTGTGESADVVVSLTHQKVVSTRTLDPARDGQMPILESDFARVDEIVKADPDWRAAMARRGYHDLGQIRTCPDHRGAFGPPEDDRRRMVRVLAFVQARSTTWPGRTPSTAWPPTST